MSVKIIIYKCLDCHYREYSPALEEQICRKLKYKDKSPYILGKPYNVSEEFAKNNFVTYGERGDIPNECPLEEN